MRVVIDDLIVELDPPPNRIGKCDGGRERHFTEAAVIGQDREAFDNLTNGVRATVPEDAGLMCR